jgi:hypothetical protein
MGPALNAQSKWGGIRESVSPSCGGDGGPDPVTFLYWLRAGEKVFLLSSLGQQPIVFYVRLEGPRGIRYLPQCRAACE